jgi:hypothetical protein
MLRRGEVEREEEEGVMGQLGIDLKWIRARETE